MRTSRQNQLRVAVASVTVLLGCGSIVFLGASPVNAATAPETDVALVRSFDDPPPTPPPDFSPDQTSGGSASLSGNKSNQLPDQIAQATNIAWQIVSSYNTVCNVVQCNMVPPTAEKAISTIGQVTTIADLTSAVHESVVVANDLSDLANATSGHVSGEPYSTETIALAHKTGNDTRTLHATLDDLVPGLSIVFPVPPPAQ